MAKIVRTIRVFGFMGFMAISLRAIYCVQMNFVNGAHFVCSFVDFISVSAYYSVVLHKRTVLKDVEMKLEIKDVAQMLDLPEATIVRWIRQGKIPAKLERGRYIFDEKQLRSWARIHNITLRENKLVRGLNDEEHITLYDAMARGGVFYDLDGDNPEQVLRTAIDVINLPADLDKELLLERLLQREELSSTGIGEGVAIPHPRQPLENFSLKAMVPTCFLKKEVDFNSIDGKPVFVIFIMLSATTKIHLRLLSRLSFCLRNEEFIRLLGYHPPQDILLEKVKELEDQL